jgi:peptidoglycan/LPS O-acetylase OafA/YrhL
MGKVPYSPAIDGLRAVAVLAVVAYHAGLGGAGYVGVDVFFVISGYLITQVLRGGFDVFDFYARRVRRIVPAAVLVVLATLAASALLLSPSQQAQTANSAGAALVFGANVFFQMTTGGYFDASADEMPLLHLWSLSVEEQFYLLWPLLMLVRRRWIVVVALASLALAEALPQSAAFYQMPARAWELAAGGLVALYAPRIRHAGVIGSVLLVFAILVPMPTFPGIGALPAVVGAALVLAGVHHGDRLPWLEAKPMVGVGLISYSLYLWHWPLLALYRATSSNKASACGLRCAASPSCWPSRAGVTSSNLSAGCASVRVRTVVAGAAVSITLALSACTYGWSVRPDQRFAQPARTCHSQRTDGPIPKCTLAGTIVWGDSMAYAWTPAFPGTSATRDACAPLLQHPDATCRAFNRNVAAAIPKGARVILAGRWQPGVDIGPTLAHLTGPVLVIGPTPEMRKDVPTCLRQGLDCAIPRAAFDAFARPILASLREAAKPTRTSR